MESPRITVEKEKKTDATLGPFVCLTSFRHMGANEHGMDVMHASSFLNSPIPLCVCVCVCMFLLGFSRRAVCRGGRKLP